MRFLLYTLIFLLGIALSIPVVAILLLTSWDGRTTPFGNSKHGRGNDHPSTPTEGYWQEYSWLVLRNPVYNLSRMLAMPFVPSTITGNANILDQREEGHYHAKAGKAWELGYVKIYARGTRCVRIRLGWKILGETEGDFSYVLSIVPFMGRDP